MIEQIAITTCEIDDDLERALQIGTDWGISNFEFRSVWGKRVPRFEEMETAKLHALIKEYGVKIVGISPSVFREEYCEGEVAKELKILDRSFDLAESLDCRQIIVFSFRRPADEAADFILEEAVTVLRNAADRAQRKGLELVHEPMPQLYGNTSTNLLKLIEAVDHPSFNITGILQTCVQVVRKACSLMVIICLSPTSDTYISRTGSLKRIGLRWIMEF